MWGATSAGGVHVVPGSISIHAPRVGSDLLGAQLGHPSMRFQSTLPVWGATAWRSLSSLLSLLFQSTLPVWGATRGCLARPHAGVQFQSTLPVWGATSVLQLYSLVGPISIHAPRVGSDTFITSGYIVHILFQSTLPVWGATPVSSLGRASLMISIHAPRVGSDACMT